MADAFCGWDIGGVHLKRSRLIPVPGGGARLLTAVVPFEIWKAPGDLAARLRVLAGPGPAHHALTMTAELSDVFPDRAAGVRAILDAFRDAVPGARARVLDLDGDLIAWEAARERPHRVAAANWMATAALAGRARDTAIVIDTGSTTTDIVPVRDGYPAPAGRTDLERLMSGELVYTGVQRTPPAALAEAVPLRGGWCRLAPEHFAVMADAYRVLGRLPEEAYTTPTPDGRGRAPGDAAARLARLVGADPDVLAPEEILAIAAFLQDRQVDLVARAIRQVRSRRARAGDLAGELAIVAGAGAFLAADAAARAGLRCERLGHLLPGIVGEGWDAAAPAAALAILPALEAGVVDGSAWRRGPAPAGDGDPR